jgi:hypothetical protein
LAAGLKQQRTGYQALDRRTRMTKKGVQQEIIVREESCAAIIQVTIRALQLN